MNIRNFSCPVCGFTKGHKTVDVQAGDSNSQDLFSVYECDNCGLGQTMPTPDTISLNRYYHNYYTEQGPSGDKRTLTKIKETLIRGTTFPSFLGSLFYYIATHMMQVVLPAPFGTKKILDVGCGYGRLLDFFKLQGWETYGVEPGVKASQFAQMNGHKVVKGELQVATFDQDFFSAAVFCHSLEHIRNPVDVLNETFRILAPGGIIVIEVPNTACADAIFFKEVWHAWHIPFHLYHWTPLSLETAVLKAGFTIDHIRSKSPKLSDYKNNINRLRNFGKKCSIDLFWHVAATSLMAQLGFNKKYYGHYITIYGQKPL